jgi:putative FmdB family regulatory protein
LERFFKPIATGPSQVHFSKENEQCRSVAAGIAEVKWRWLASPYHREVTMPHYIFYCQACKKEFTQVVHISELEKGGIKCPLCGSGKVDQKVVAFSAVTSKKS